MLQKSSANKGNPAEDWVFHVQLRKNRSSQHALFQTITKKVIFVAFFSFLPKVVPKIFTFFALFCFFILSIQKKVVPLRPILKLKCYGSN